MPGLPLFGTVSAATPLTPVESNHDMGSEVSSTATRVSQVGEDQERLANPQISLGDTNRRDNFEIIVTLVPVTHTTNDLIFNKLIGT